MIRRGHIPSSPGACNVLVRCLELASGKADRLSGCYLQIADSAADLWRTHHPDPTPCAAPTRLAVVRGPRTVLRPAMLPTGVNHFVTRRATDDLGAAVRMQVRLERMTECELGHLNLDVGRGVYHNLRHRPDRGEARVATPVVGGELRGGSAWAQELVRALIALQAIPRPRPGLEERQHAGRETEVNARRCLASQHRLDPPGERSRQLFDQGRVGRRVPERLYRDASTHPADAE